MSRCLFAFRHLPACLCIASLLFSNVAGWLHIGCVDSTAGSCVETSSSVANSRREQTGCCKHAHVGDSSHRHSPNETSDSQPTRGHDECPRDHDSERCSICQSFFSLRNASGNASPLPTVTSDAVEIAAFITVCVGERTILSDSISVRGPPRV
mgnify:FL=1|jgi:hypothetical protein